MPAPLRSTRAAPVSVIIPVRDRRDFLADALASVFAQTLPPAEVIVIDDGSTEPLDDVVGTFPGVELLRQPPLGAYVARNRGLAAARQPFVAFLDSDDIWLPHKLEAQLPLFDAPEIGVVFGDAAIREFSDSVHSRIRVRAFRVAPPGDCRADTLAFGSFVPFSSLVVRRRVFDMVGTFDARSRLSADWVWLVRARLTVPFAYVPEIVSEYRRHAGNWSRSYPLALNARVEQFQELLTASNESDRALFQQVLFILRLRIALARLRNIWKETPAPPAWIAGERVGLRRAASLSIRFFARELRIRTLRLLRPTKNGGPKSAVLNPLVNSQ